MAPERSVFPEPVPLGWELGAAENTDGERWLMVKLYHVTGQTELFFTAEAVRELIGDLQHGLARLETEGVPSG